MPVHGGKHVTLRLSRYDGTNVSEQNIYVSGIGTDMSQE